MEYCHFTPKRGENCVCIVPYAPKKETVRNEMPPDFIAFSLDNFEEGTSPSSITAASDLLILNSTRSEIPALAIVDKQLITNLQLMAYASNIEKFTVKKSPYKRSYKFKPRVLERFRIKQLKLFREMCDNMNYDVMNRLFNLYGYVPMDYDEKKWKTYVF